MSPKLSYLYYPMFVFDNFLLLLHIVKNYVTLYMNCEIYRILCYLFITFPKNSEKIFSKILTTRTSLTSVYHAFFILK